MKKSLSNAMFAARVIVALPFPHSPRNAYAQGAGGTAAGTNAGTSAGNAGVKGSGGIGAGAAGSGLSVGPSGSIAGPGRSAPDKSATVGEAGNSGTNSTSGTYTNNGAPDESVVFQFRKFERNQSDPELRLRITSYGRYRGKG